MAVSACADKHLRPLATELVIGGTSSPFANTPVPARSPTASREAAVIFARPNTLRTAPELRMLDHRGPPQFGYGNSIVDSSPFQKREEILSNSILRRHRAHEVALADLDAELTAEYCRRSSMWK